MESVADTGLVISSWPCPNIEEEHIERVDKARWLEEEV